MQEKPNSGNKENTSNSTGQQTINIDKPWPLVRQNSYRNVITRDRVINPSQTQNFQRNIIKELPPR